MIKLIKAALVFLAISSLAGCDSLINQAGAEFLKLQLKDICGSEDTACIAAVDRQFGACHSKYEEGWERYMDSSASQEDKFLEVYSVNMYGCIVDENGDPYFVYEQG